MRNRNHIFRTEKLVVRKIGGIGGNLAFLQRLQHRIGIHQISTGEIQDTDAVLHLLQGGSAYQILGFRGKRNMERYVIAGCKYFIQRLSVVDGTGEVPGRIHREEGVVAIHLSLIHI